MVNLGKLLIVVGGGIALLGLVLVAGQRFGLGRLPGDLHFGRRGVEVWIPITSMLLVSLVVSLLLHLFRR